MKRKTKQNKQTNKTNKQKTRQNKLTTNKQKQKQKTIQQTKQNKTKQNTLVGLSNSNFHVALTSIIGIYIRVMQQF